MNIKGIIAFAAASALICGTAASCSSSEKKKSSDSSKSAADTKKNEKSAGTEFEEAVVAESGDAYLAVVDKDWKMQYWGGNEDNNQLAYDAGVVHIDGNGDYKVSVNADTRGFRYRATGNPDTEYKPYGLGFAAVIINDAEKTMPDAIITVKNVKIDGKDIELNKKSYTNTEGGAVRSNIFNEWVSDDSLPGDARVDGGMLFNNNDSASPSDINDGGYSAQIIDVSALTEWTTVEVEFSVSGLKATPHKARLTV